jgi:hypothetical protein
MKQEIVTVGLDLAKSFFKFTRLGAMAPSLSGASFGAQR